MSITEFKGSKFEKAALAAFVPMAKAQKKYDTEHSKIAKDVKAEAYDEKQLAALVKKYTQDVKVLAGNTKIKADPMLIYQSVIDKELKKGEKLIDQKIKVHLEEKKALKAKHNSEEYISKGVYSGNGNLKTAAMGAYQSAKFTLSILLKEQKDLKKRKK